MSGWSPPTSDGLIQAMMVKPSPAPTSKDWPAGILMHELTPLKENACPTLPSAKEISVNVAVFPPAESLPIPSPDHNATKPGGWVPAMLVADTVRSEERRVGKACRSPRAP